MLDLAVVGGTVVDGTGGPARPADVGVAAGRVVAIEAPGGLPPAAETLDAAGHLVTPGFVDPHTHMDAQLWWDPSGSPSVLHGVTTVVLGSCGFGVAPLAEGTGEYVLRSLESVEEIPYRSTSEAVPMTWRDWASYFEALESLPLGVNVASFVPHSALRVGTLGERGRADDLEDAEVARLAGALERALAEGAVGFSSSRGTNHHDAYGDPVPSRRAGDAEVERLVAAAGGRIWQMNIAAKGSTDEAGIAAATGEVRRYAEWSARHRTLLTWTPLVVAPGDDVAWRRLLEASAATRRWVLPQVSPQPMGGSVSFDGPSFAGMIVGWSKAFAGYGDLTDAERAARLGDPAVREALAAVPEDCARITSPCYRRWVVAVSPSAPDAVGLNLDELGERAGRHPVDALFDLALADDLQTVVSAALSNVDEEAVRELVASDVTMLGIGDAGAHIKSISNFGYPTWVLGELAGRRGWLSVPEAVRRLSGQPARAFGLEGRGELRVGAWADLCVVDLGALRLEPAEMVADIPGGSRRLHRGARGFRAVVVNGHPVVRDDRPASSGAPGRVLRVA